MKLNNQAIVEHNTAKVHLNKLDLASYTDLINLRTLPVYNVVGQTVEFPATYLDDYYKAHEKELPLPVTDKLFDYQKVIVKVSYLKERYGIFLDPGLGKTMILGELVRQLYHHVSGKIVVCVPLNIIRQFEEMCQTFFDDFPPFVHLHSSTMTIKEWCHYGDGRVAFVNHEAFIKPQDLKGVDAFLLDEASILKGGIGGNGKIAQHIIKAVGGVKYRFAASGTPAPNDKVEYAMIALFLGLVRSEKEFYSLYFVNKNGDYVLKKHAVEAFYRYLAFWSIFMRNPAAYGFENNLKDLKPWREVHEVVEMTQEQLEMLGQWAKVGEQPLLPGVAVIPNGMGQRSKFSQISKGFVYDGDNVHYVPSLKPQHICSIVNRHKGQQVIIWAVFDEEGDILDKALTEAGYKVAHITGSTKETRRLELIEQFRHGGLDIIISKPRILGYGLNFQFCHIEIFSGLQDSYEQYYQAVKRVHRYGQTEQVLIYIVYTQYEEVIIQNVLRKQTEMQRDFEYQERLYISSLADELKQFLLLEDYNIMETSDIKYNPIKNSYYELVHGDSLKTMLEIGKGARYGSLAPNSVDFSVFSPPFMGDIFTYSKDPADMGNTRGAGAEGGLDEFMLQFRFFLEGMKIVTKPGRLMAMHLEDVPLRKGLDGHVGIFDFVGHAIREANAAGWILVGKIPILKNQQMQSIVKHVSNLAMPNMEKDRARIAPATNGYLCLFEKPGENIKPISSPAVCNNCDWTGVMVELANRTPKHYQYPSQPFNARNEPRAGCCPSCGSYDVNIHSEMNGDKWILCAEGIWPEHQNFHQDFKKLTDMTQEQRWLDLIQTALGVWFDITESDVLPAMNKMSEDADKHLCPLPRSIARRAIEMYTNPGETVFTPFAGIGTELDAAIRLGRKAIGIELKPEYFIQADANADKAVKESTQMTLFNFNTLAVAA